MNKKKHHKKVRIFHQRGCWENPRQKWLQLNTYKEERQPPYKMQMTLDLISWSKKMKKENRTYIYTRH